MAVLLVGRDIRRNTATSATARGGDCQKRSTGGKHKIEVLCGGEVGLGEVRSGVERTRVMKTRHLSVDRISLSGIRGELDGPERLKVGGKSERGEEGEKGDSSHGWGLWGGRRRSRTDNARLPSEYIRI